MSALRLPAFGELADNSWSLSQKKLIFGAGEAGLASDSMCWWLNPNPVFKTEDASVRRVLASHVISSEAYIVRAEPTQSELLLMLLRTPGLAETNDVSSNNTHVLYARRPQNVIGPAISRPPFLIPSCCSAQLRSTRHSNPFIFIHISDWIIYRILYLLVSGVSILKHGHIILAFIQLPNSKPRNLSSGKLQNAGSRCNTQIEQTAREGSCPATPGAATHLQL